MGLPGMPPTELAGRIDAAIPVFNHEAVLARALQAHTDVLTADNTLLKAKYQLQLAQITPVPDVTVNMVIQKDYTGPPFNIVYSLQAGVPIPIFDRNQGGIIQAQAMVVQSSEEADRVRGALTTRMADAFERYDNNRRLLHIYRDEILPDQVRAYRATYDRYQKEGPPGAAFADVVVAQQALATSVTTYVGTLGTMWQAVVDVADVLQTDDLFQVGLDGPPDLPCPVPDLRALAPLPCRHPCSPLHDPALKGAHGDWPPAAAEPIAPPAYKPPPEPVKPKPEPAPEPAAQQAPETPPAPTNPTADPLLEPPPEVPPVGKAPSALP
jgi:cobalt-zinc-cadmium efflux system outer membrane protein